MLPFICSRVNMDYFTKPSFWFAAAAILAACDICAGASNRRPFKPSDSILDIINTKEVEKLIAERRRVEQASAATTYVTNNHADGTSETLVISAPDLEESTEIPSGTDFRNILKSSKNALVVTKKEYLKEDWCKTEHLVQRIREPGCLPTTVINNFCYGQCNSFFIPRAPRRRDSEERPPPAFKSCSVCKPKKMTWVTVKLRCPGQNPPYRLKRIQKIKQCKCLPVGVN
ncbi:gremlin-2 [Amyelois transitella]|uniref:gremlin-2 n=1 Tax=Amyelois transitella TaxID=680683 RepID=UPI00067BB21F|nr:gremlin-2 [Amyelois transitella]